MERFLANSIVCAHVSNKPNFPFRKLLFVNLFGIQNCPSVLCEYISVDDSQTTHSLYNCTNRLLQADRDRQIG